MTLLKSKEELDTFISFLPQLEKDEVWFISLSCRNKYLDDSEREKYKLNRSEMFARKLIYETSFKAFDFVLKQLESELEWRTTRSEEKYPEKALVVYLNICPSSMIKAYEAFKQTMNANMFELIQALEHNKDTTQLYHRFTRFETTLKNSIQVSSSRKTLIDIDFDSKDEKLLQAFCLELTNKQVKYFVVSTKSGYHVCMYKDTVKFNYNSLVEVYNQMLLDKLFSEEKGEIVVNKNNMIPLPGTIQAGTVVTNTHWLNNF